MPEPDDSPGSTFWRRLTGWWSGADAERLVSQGADNPSRDQTVIEVLVSGLPDPVVVLDADANIIAFNRSAAELSSTLRHGQPLAIGLRVPELVDAVRRTAETGNAQHVEFSERGPSDSWWEAVVAPAWLPAGEGTSARLSIITLHDLTPIRQVEEMRADFVANASHELRTPLAALSGFIETLQGPARDDSKARERFLDIMKTQARRMARLIDDLLSLSRIELRAHTPPNTPLDIVPIVRQVAESLQTLAGDRDVTIATDLPAEPLTVRGDRDELIRLFENLIENGLKYGASGKRVEVTATRGETPSGKPEIQVRIRDYGPGIAAEHLPRLTERFYRVDVSDSRAQGGTGLGLALVKHILNRHQGRLSIESQFGQGATFIVRLPPLQEAAERNR